MDGSCSTLAVTPSWALTCGPMDWSARPGESSTARTTSSSSSPTTFSPDGKRFLMIRRDEGSVPRQLNVILNWSGGSQ